MWWYMLIGVSAFVRSRVDYSAHKLYRFNITDSAGLEELKDYVYNNQIDAWSEPQVGLVDLRLTPQQSQVVGNQLSLKYNVISNNLQELFDKEMLHSRSGAFPESYHSVFEINRYMEDILARFNGTASLFSIGESYEKRSIMGIRFRRPKATKSILYHGGIHAREWISTAVIVYLIDNFARGKDSDLISLLDTYEFHFIPVVNVDGYEYSRTVDRLWRKNRQPNSGRFCVGTDLNRNWDIQWRAEPSICSDSYPGDTAFSAPESRAVADYIRDQGNFVHYVDFHSYNQLMMTPYGYNCDLLPPDYDAQSMVSKLAVNAIKDVQGREYKRGSVCKSMSQSFGTPVDWAYDVAKIKYAYTIELPDKGKFGYSLPPSHIKPIGEEMLAALKVLGSSVKSREGL